MAVWSGGAREPLRVTPAAAPRPSGVHSCTTLGGPHAGPLPAPPRARAPARPDGGRVPARGRPRVERHGRANGAALHADQRSRRQHRAALHPRPRRLAHPGRHLRHGRRRPRRPRRPPGRGRALRATAATCSPSTPARTRLRVQGRARPARARRPVAGSGGTAPVSIDAAARPRVRAQLRRHAERRGVRSRERRRRSSRSARRSSPRAPPAPRRSPSCPTASSLVVSERTANRLETLPLDRSGRPGAPVVTPSSGAVPFGFGITQRGHDRRVRGGREHRVVVPLGRRRARSAPSPPRAGRPGRRLLGRRLAVGPLRLHGQRVRPHQRLRGRARRRADRARRGRPHRRLVPSPRDLDFDASGRFLLAVVAGQRGHRRAGDVVPRRRRRLADASSTPRRPPPASPGPPPPDHDGSRDRP